MTYCKCTHLSSFGGGFAVAPNKIDFAFVFANAGFTQNLTIYCMEIVTAVLYILLFIWCRREDKKDIIKVSNLFISKYLKCSDLGLVLLCLIHTLVCFNATLALETTDVTIDSMC